MAIPDWITISTSDKSGGTGTSSTTKSISIKASENKSLSSRTGSLTFKPSKGTSKTVSITQSAGVYSFGALSSSLTYSTDIVPASGGTLSSYSIWWSLPYGWNGNSSNAGTMNSSNYTNYKGVSLSSWSWSSSSSSVSVSGGKVTIQSAGTTHYADAQTMAKITATATLTIAAGSAFGNSSAISFTIECVDYVFREANTKTLVGIKLEPYQPDSTWLPIDSDGNWSICPAGNSYIRAGKRYVYSFPSGASEISDRIAVNLLDDLEWSDTSWIERHATTGVHVKSRGTVIGSKRSTTATLKESGFTVSRVLTQEANTLSYYYYDPVVSLSCQDIPAGGGSISSGSVSYSQKVNNDYTSGSQTQSTLTSGGTVSYSAAVSASSLGTTIKARTAVGSLTATVTMNGKSGWKSVTVYQGYNVVKHILCYLDDVNDISVGEGSTTVLPSCEISTEVFFSSGEYKSGVPSSTYGTYTESIEYELDSDVSGFSLQSSLSGEVSVSENKSLSPRSVDVNVYGNNYWTPKSGYDFSNSGRVDGFDNNSFSITQSAGYYSYSAYSVSASASTTSIAASGGSASINASSSRTYGWNGSTSGAGTQSSNVSLSIQSGSGASLSGATLTFSNNTSASSRSVVVRVTCANDTSKYKDITFTQAAGSKVYSSWGGGAISFNSTSALSAGSDSRTVTIQPWTRTWTWNGTGSASTEYYTGSVTLSENGNYTSLNTTSYTASSSSKSVTLTKSSCGTAATSSTTVTVTAVGATTTTKSISQEANTASYVYGDVVITGYYDGLIPASGGGGVADPGYGEQTIKATYTSGASDETTKRILAAAKDKYLEADNVPSLGTTIKEKTVIKSNTVTFTGEGGKSASVTIYVYQAANKIESTTYGDPSLGLTPVQMTGVPASGTSANITLSVSQNKTDTYTSTATSTTRIIPSYTITRLGVTSQEEAEYCMTTQTSTGFYISITENNTYSERSGYVLIEVTANGKTGDAEFHFSQQAGASRTALTASPFKILALASGGNFTITIYQEYDGAQYQFDAVSDITISSPYWISEVSRTLEDGTIKLVVSIGSNPYQGGTRTGNIVVEMTDGSASLTIPVSQSAP